MSGLRVLVVGASSGIGQEVAAQLVAAGAQVATAARRVERLAELHGVKTTLRCDARDPSQCDEVAGAACERLGGLDALVYATGVTRITPLHESGIQDWREVFETNLFGAAMVTKAALPHLTISSSQGRVVMLSSDSADLAYPGLVAYSASKAALSRFCQGFAVEAPALRVTEVVVGPTLGTEGHHNFDPVEFEHWLKRWIDEGFVRYDLQEPSEVASVILDTLRAESPPARLLAAAPSAAR
jgi:NAD(P)-dependent dehydrogenase (short-subunit alcohol dehydrogenase family)